jgi:hypothetical protein
MHSLLLHNFPGILCARREGATHALETAEVQQRVQGPRTEHRFPVSPLASVTNLLSSNRRCLQNHYLAMGLYATIIA